VFIYFELDRGELLPALSMFALASLRLMPSFNLMISGVSKMRFSINTVALLYDDVVNFQDENDKNYADRGILSGFDNLELNHVFFTYSGQATSNTVLSDVTLNIKNGEAIGIIGGSGVGKTTMINIIAGLLEPTKGVVRCNGIDISQDRSGYMSMLAYLPQQVFTIDDTILKNVAFGVDASEIDVKKVRESLHKAKLLEFVDELEKGMETIVGERGVKISGGQKQRLALARAFYHDRSVLIMDESTSALDEAVEKEVINEIKQLKREKTMVIIAHRMSTIQHCDKVYRIDKGCVVRER